MAERHFVKYTFLKVDPAWRRLDADERAAATSASSSPPARTSATDHLLQAFSLVGTRGDADLMLVAEAENLDRIHEFHVVLAQSGLMKWCSTALLVPRDAQDARSTPTSSASIPRPFRGKYLFVYPFVKTRAWYAPARRRALADHAGAHQGRPRVPDGRQPHDVLVRPRRPGVRRRVRHRRRRRVPRPRAAAAHDRGVGLHPARHADASPASPTSVERGAQRARRRAPVPSRASSGRAPGGGTQATRRRRSRTCAQPTRCCARAGRRRRRRSEPGRPARARRPLRRAGARDRRPAAVDDAPRARSTGGCSTSSAAARRRRRRCSTTTPRRCARRSGCRAPRSAYLRSLAEHVRRGELDLDRARRAARRRGDRASSPRSRASASGRAHMFLMFQLEPAGRPRRSATSASARASARLRAARSCRRRPSWRRSPSRGARTARSRAACSVALAGQRPAEGATSVRARRRLRLFVLTRNEEPQPQAATTFGLFDLEAGALERLDVVDRPSRRRTGGSAHRRAAEARGPRRRRRRRAARRTRAGTGSRSSRRPDADAQPGRRGVGLLRGRGTRGPSRAPMSVNVMPSAL